VVLMEVFSAVAFFEVNGTGGTGRAGIPSANR
jgi:hypothetical protein